MKITDINWDGSKIRIRPSSVDTFANCPYQWAKVFLEYKFTIPGARAAIGTAVHKGVEAMWLESMPIQTKDHINVSSLCDAAIDCFDEMDNADTLHYTNGEDCNTAHDEIVRGMKTFVEDIVPYTDIPDEVEKFYTMPLKHDVVSELGGTIDYISGTVMADVKTSKRKPNPASHLTQQTTYKILAEHNGKPITHNLIQAVAFTKKATGHIVECPTNEKRVKFAINSLLDTLDAFNNGVDPGVLFRGNPKYYLCSNAYCSLHDTCPYVNG